MKMILNTISFLALILLCGINFVASESRALNTFTSPNLVEIFSISDTTNITKWSNFSVYEFSFSTLSAPLFRFATLQKQTDAVAAFAFRVGILALVEYNDTIPIENSTSFIDFPQYGMQWSKFNESDQNPGVKEFDTSLVIKNTTGNNPTNISIAAFIASNTTNFQGTVLSPSKLKYTLSFTNYPYQYQNSSIAIIKSVFYASGAAFTNSQSAFTINATNDTAGDFSWSGTVLADGKNTSITLEDDVIWQKSQNLTGQNVSPNNATNSIIAQANETFLLLAFKINAVQPQSVVWDPSIGLLNSTGNPSDNSTNNSGTNPSSTSGNTSKSIGTKLVYQTSLLSYLILGAIMIIFF